MKIAVSRCCFPVAWTTYVGEENPARVIDVFVEELDLGGLGFEILPAATGRPAYHPATLLRQWAEAEFRSVRDRS